MEKSIGELIYDSSIRIRLHRASITKKNEISDLSDKEILLLELLSAKKRLSIADVVLRYPAVSKAMVSMTITKLWRKKLLDKMDNPENQRIKDITLTNKGIKIVEEYKKTRSDVYKTIIDSLGLNKSEEKTFKKILTRSIEYFDKMLNLK